MKLWDPATGKLLHECYEPIPGPPEQVEAAGAVRVFFALGGSVAVTDDESKEGTLRIWDVATGKRLHAIRAHSKFIRSVALGPDGKGASAAEDGTARTWDVVTGKLLRRSNHTQNSDKRIVEFVAYAPDGNTLASGRGDNTIRIWDAHTGKLLHTHERNGPLAYLSGAKVLAGGGGPASVCGPRDREVDSLRRGTSSRHREVSVTPRREQAGLGQDGQNGPHLGGADAACAGITDCRTQLGPAEARWPDAAAALRFRGGA
jgi:WD40 repeat protein